MSLSENEKNQAVELLGVNGFELEDFRWDIQKRCGPEGKMNKVSVLIYHSKGFYFLFGKNKEERFWSEYFPNWALRNLSEDRKELVCFKEQLQDFVHWLKSIQRSFERSRSIVVSLEQGKKDRRRLKEYIGLLGN